MRIWKEELIKRAARLRQSGKTPDEILALLITEGMKTNKNALVAALHRYAHATGITYPKLPTNKETFTKKDVAEWRKMRKDKTWTQIAAENGTTLGNVCRLLKKDLNGELL